MGAYAILFVVIGLFLLPLGILLWHVNTPETLVKEPETALEKFYDCLREKDVVLACTDFNAACQEQKKMLGPGYEYLRPLNCDYQKGSCNDHGITTYPTWVFPKKKKFEILTLDEIEELSGCSLVDWEDEALNATV